MSQNLNMTLLPNKFRITANDYSTTQLNCTQTVFNSTVLLLNCSVQYRTIFLKLSIDFETFCILVEILQRGMRNFNNRLKARTHCIKCHLHDEI